MLKIITLVVWLFCTLRSDAQLVKKLDSLLFQQPRDQPGFALLIEQDGKVLYNRQVGLAVLEGAKQIEAATNFRMASITKQFTAMAILLLEKNHQLSVNDAICKWFPGLPAGVGSRVHISHLLTHSSGILDYEELMPASQTRQLLDADVLQLLQSHDTTYFTPGTQFRYSNSGFCLLALIIEKVSHQPYAAFIKQKIFTPLQMNESVVYEDGQPIAHRAMGYAKDSVGTIVPSDQSVTSATKGDGGVYTSIKDYYKWIKALQRGELLNVSEMMRQLHFAAADITNAFYSAGWFYTSNRPVVWFHSGSTCGFNNYVINIPSQKTAIVFFSNMADNAALFHRIIKLIHQNGLDDYSNLFALHDLTR